MDSAMPHPLASRTVRLHATPDPHSHHRQRRAPHTNPDSHPPAHTRPVPSRPHPPPPHPPRPPPLPPAPSRRRPAPSAPTSTRVTIEWWIRALGLIWGTGMHRIHHEARIHHRKLQIGSAHV